MWITWKNTATATTGALTDTDELTVELDVRLYGVGLDTRIFPTNNAALPINAASPGTWTFDWYLQFMNPYDTAFSNTPAGAVPAFTTTTVLYDGVVGELEFTVAPGTPPAYDTAVLDWKNANPGELRDVHCSLDGPEIATNCTDDTEDNWVAITTAGTEQCVEKWNLEVPAIRCVRLASSFKRVMMTPDPNSQDINIDYRPYMVSAGWITQGQTTTPMKWEGPRQAVDFHRFREQTPESDWNGAISSMGVSCAALAAAVMTFLF